MKLDGVLVLKCHWQTGRMKGGGWKEFCTGLKLVEAGRGGEDVLVDGVPGHWRVVEVKNPEDYHFVETPVIPIKLSRSLMLKIARMLNASQDFEKVVGPGLVEILDGRFDATPKKWRAKKTAKKR